MASSEEILAVGSDGFPKPYDPRDALHLPKGTKVVVHWYRPQGGFHYCAGQVLETRKNSIKLLVVIPGDARHRLVLKVRPHGLCVGRVVYDLRPPNEKEISTVEKKLARYFQQKLGWRYTAKLRYELLKDWQHWARKRQAELLAGEDASWRYRVRQEVEDRLDWRWWARRKLKELGL